MYIEMYRTEFMYEWRVKLKEKDSVNNICIFHPDVHFSKLSLLNIYLKYYVLHNYIMYNFRLLYMLSIVELIINQQDLLI